MSKLTDIKGIGPAFAKRLVAAGIADATVLAGAKVEDLTAVPGVTENRAKDWKIKAKEVLSAGTASDPGPLGQKRRPVGKVPPPQSAQQSVKAAEPTVTDATISAPQVDNVAGEGPEPKAKKKDASPKKKKAAKAKSGKKLEKSKKSGKAEKTLKTQKKSSEKKKKNDKKKKSDKKAKEKKKSKAKTKKKS
ncbi:helix-hairpin-helix domain-containing protein [Sulfitobacter sp. D35]|uniref:helix-hairpin-helix domain-containing protein n=1 Tax=Sulfitobacter sp. D35 TaxID=3083252 RepID=UPI00296EADAB|nr:helix-hairpin-helix domain-containing protein [Sulfitobacter sp. D35]MDW4499208.1 helix-hairpin-helix domain-containing protein [Sulfitobacter sp. D35]